MVWDIHSLRIRSTARQGNGRYYYFHDYLETRSRVEATCRRAVELSQKYGKPVINNETGCLCRSNPYDMAVETADRYGIGWYLFELMIEEEGGMWSKVHGIVYPDGTVRDPSIVAAILGFFRNRNETAIQSDVNQEGHADKAIAAARDALEKGQERRNCWRLRKM